MKRLGATPNTWYHCSSVLVGHYVYLAGKMGQHSLKGRNCTIVPILDTVRNTWRWIPCEGPSCYRVSLALYDDWLYWLGEERWHESEKWGVSRFDVNLEEWELCEVLGDGPGPRMGCSLHLHEARKQLVVFGGIVGSVKQNDVHLLDFRLSSWVDVVVKGRRPLARYEHSSWMRGDVFYCFGGWTKADGLHRDGLNVLHFGLRNVVTWSSVKETVALCSLVAAIAIPLDNCLLVLGGHKDKHAHIASLWDSTPQTLEQVACGGNSNLVRSAHAAVKTNSDIFMFGPFDNEGCLRISLEASP